jgi:hypothetical protein
LAKGSTNNRRFLMGMVTCYKASSLYRKDKLKWHGKWREQKPTLLGTDGACRLQSLTQQGLEFDTVFRHAAHELKWKQKTDNPIKAREQTTQWPNELNKRRRNKDFKQFNKLYRLNFEVKSIRNIRRPSPRCPFISSLVISF